MVRIAPVRLHAGDEAVGLVETRDVVDVAVGVVADNPLAHPQHLLDAEVVAQILLDVAAEEPRIAVLVQEALLAGEQQARAVHVDGAAFKHHVVFKAVQLQRARDARRDFVVEIVGRILAAPGVVHPVGHGDLPGAPVLHEDRSVVAAPGVVRRMVVELHPGHVRAGLRAQALRPRLEFRRAVDAHVLEAADLFHNLSEDIRDRTKLPRPGRTVVRPRKPDGFLRLPLGGHLKPQLRRGFDFGFWILGLQLAHEVGRDRWARRSLLRTARRSVPTLQSM